MQDDRSFWVIDQRVVEYVRFPEFHWIELVVLFVGLGALASYALFAVYLDRRARTKRRRLKQVERLERWLEDWQLEPGEEAALHELAGSDDPAALYALLADPARFERAAHEVAQRGERLPVLDRIREELGYTSGDLHVPMVSTRQVQPGDHFRFSVWEGGRPQHHYGVVASVSPPGVMVELTEAGFNAVRSSGAEVDLFFLRGNDVEYRLPLVVRNRDAPRSRLLLDHQLVRPGQRGRSTRLPVLKRVTMRAYPQLSGPTQHGAAPPVDADGTAPAPRQAGEAVTVALLEMSDGGFSVVLLRPVAEGSYLEYLMPLPRGRELPIMGRVLDCRSFTGNRWLARCELRGLSPTQRNTLSQVLRLEQQRRIKAMHAERRKRRRADVPVA